MLDQQNKLNFRLKEFRKRLGLKQDEMAAELSRITADKITQGMVSNYESGRFEPGFTILYALFSLGLSPDYLFLGDGPMLHAEKNDPAAPVLETKRFAGHTEYVIRVKG